MTILLTGGTGFLGSHVAEQLSRAGRPVRALARASSDTEFLRSLPGVEIVYGSLEDRASLGRALDGVSHVLHSAGVLKAKTPYDFLYTNAAGTENLAQAAVEAGSVKRFVFVSSLTVAGPSSGGRPVTEDQAPNPLTYYGRSKLEAELAVLAKKDQMPVTVLRPGAVFGPRDREVFLFFQSVMRRVLPMVAPSSNRVSMIYASDCAAACVLALDAEVASGRVYYLDDGSAHTFAEMLSEIESALGKRTLLSFRLPSSVVLGAAFATEMYGKLSDQAVIFTRDKCKELFAEWVCDGSLARRELGFEPKVTFSEGVRLTADWYRKAGWL